jgi:phosphatidylserine/phosphatidylglycerophosphate/cardiolipin synthase-like enzyme
MQFQSLLKSFCELARISDAVTLQPLVGGNRIETLHNGEQAYPAMLEAIEAAEHTLFLTTYIFDTNRTGRQFIDGLTRATAVSTFIFSQGTQLLLSLVRSGNTPSTPSLGPEPP